MKILSESTDAKLPLFVFVDELDRCRPSYAIHLLEEIKHIFGITNVAYIVSTNLLQLQNSACALYGVNFDGQGYLRRLFDREYVLPKYDNEKFSKRIINEDSFLAKAKIYLIPHITHPSLRACKVVVASVQRRG